MSLSSRALSWPWRVVFSAMAIVLLALAIAACGSSSDSGDESGTAAAEAEAGAGAGADSAKEARLALLLTGNSPYGEAMEAAGTREADAQGATIDFFQAEFNPTKQYSQCQDAITSQRFDALLIYPVDGTSMVPCAKQAIEKGIKVIAVDTALGPEFNTLEPQVEGLTGSVVILPAEGAKFSTDLVLKACGDLDPCRASYMMGCRTCAYDTAKLEALKAEFAKHPNLEMISVGEDGYSVDGGRKRAQDVLQADADVNVIFSSADESAIGALSAIDDAGRTGDVKVAGGGATTRGVEEIEAGNLVGSYVLLPQTEIETAVAMAVKAVRGEPIEKTAVNTIDLSPVGPIVTKSNAAEFTPEYGPDAEGVGG